MSDPERDAERMERAAKAAPPELPIIGPGRDRTYLVSDADRTRPANSTTSTSVPGDRGIRAPMLLPGTSSASPRAVEPHAPIYPQRLPGAQPAKLLVAVEERR